MKTHGLLQSYYGISHRLVVGASILVAATVAWTPGARAQKADDAVQILKAMSDYVAESEEHLVDL